MKSRTTTGRHMLIMLAIMVVAFALGMTTAFATSNQVHVLGTQVSNGAETTYWVSDGGTPTKLTSEGANSTNYNVKYEGATNTLYLNNLQSSHASSYYNYAYVHLDTAATTRIVLEGSNFFKYGSGSPTVNTGVKNDAGGEIIIEGSGSLETYSTEAGMCVFNGTGSVTIRGGNLLLHTVKNGSTSNWGIRAQNYLQTGGSVYLDVNSGGYDAVGINGNVTTSGNGDFEIIGGTLDIRVNTDGIAYGMWGFNDIDFSGGDVTISLSNANQATQLMDANPSISDVGAVYGLYADGSNTIICDGTENLAKKIADKRGDYGVLEELRAQRYFHAGAKKPTPTPVPGESFIVKFNSNEGTKVPSQVVNKGGKVVEPADPTKPSYLFAGWFKDEECTIPWDFANDTVEGDTTLHAKWIDNIQTLLMATGKGGLSTQTITWTTVTGAAGYDIYFNLCGEESLKFAGTVNAGVNKFVKEKTNKKQIYKYKVKAFIYEGDEKVYIQESPVIHVANKKSGRSNAKTISIDKTSVKLEIGNTAKITGKVTSKSGNSRLLWKKHCAKIRYLSSDKSVATVSRSGVVTATGLGRAYIYTFSPNGIYKKTLVEVK